MYDKPIKKIECLNKFNYQDHLRIFQKRTALQEIDIRKRPY